MLDALSGVALAGKIMILIAASCTSAIQCPVPN
jgi:hypothetical protein